MKKNHKVLILVFLAVFLGAGIFYGGFLFGVSQKRVVEKNENVLNVDFSLFWDAVNLAKEKHINAGEKTDEDFLYGAIRGAMGALDDPYTSFFNPGDSKKFNEDINGSFGGIGAEIGASDGQLLIIAPLKNSPAEKTGLKAGDKILKINDAITNDLSIDEAVKLIRGEPGTDVKLLIFRDGWKEVKEFSVKREIIKIPTLDWEIKPGNIVYIRLYNFNGNAASLFYQASLAALMKGTKGVVLDLRDNPGGFLDVAVNIAGWFLGRGETVVREKLRSGEEDELKTNGNGALKKIPVVVLINGGSASASEILAGALRDNRGAKLIGEKTFGKGTVQGIENLKNGSSLKISIAEWFTPKGGKIEKTGLAPDVEVKITEEDVEKGNDPQFEKALQIIKGEIK